MKHCFTILLCTLLLVTVSCKKEDQDPEHKIRNIRAEAIDATTAQIEFDLYLTEEDISRIEYQPEIITFFSYNADPKETLENGVFMPGLTSEGWYRVKEDGETYPKVGKNHCVFMNMSLPYGSVEYTGYIRAQLRLLNREDLTYDYYWSDLCEVLMPPIGTPYVRNYIVSNIDKTSADITATWSGNGYYLRKSGCLISTDKAQVQKNEGRSVEATVNARTIRLTDLEPGTTYYFRLWCIEYDVFTGKDIETVFAEEIGSFTTL